MTSSKIRSVSTIARDDAANKDFPRGITLGDGSFGNVYYKDRQQRVVRKLFASDKTDSAIVELQTYRKLPPSCYFPRLEFHDIQYLESDESRFAYIDMAYEEHTCDLNDAFTDREDPYIYTPLNRRLLIADLVLAIGQLHELGLLHVDLKPDNCFVLPNSHLKLFDLGHSCQIGEDVELTGTVAYCSPQLLTLSLEKESFKPTAADDLYSLGHMLCFIMTEACNYHHMKNFTRMNGTQMPARHNSDEERRFYIANHMDVKYLDFLLSRAPLKEAENEAITNVIGCLLQPNPELRMTYSSCATTLSSRAASRSL